jgi:hypothetical protein
VADESNAGGEPAADTGKRKPVTTTASMVPYALQKKRQEAKKAAKSDDEDEDDYTGSFFKARMSWHGMSWPGV